MTAIRDRLSNLNQINNSPNEGSQESGVRAVTDEVKPDEVDD